MSSKIQPIKVWGKIGPNPPKVAMILEELDLPYETVEIDFAQVKQPEFLAVNPNGRMPAIQDPNTNITLWESGAIIEYLIERYDTENKLSFAAGTPESYHAKQWLYFQTSGQGPYYGNAVFFMRYHPEKLPSAVERFTKEIGRVTGVLEGHLAKQKSGNGDDGPWLVGNKFSYADVAWVPWQALITKIVNEDQFNPDDYPHVKEWLGKVLARKAIKTVFERAMGGR